MLFACGVRVTRGILLEPKDPKGASSGRDSQAIIEWKAGTTWQRTHLKLGFEQKLRTAQVDENASLLDSARRKAGRFFFQACSSDAKAKWVPFLCHERF